MLFIKILKLLNKFIKKFLFLKNKIFIKIITLINLKKYIFDIN